MILLSNSCSQVKPKVEHEEVSVEAALDQAQSSYLLGCVEAFNSAKVTPAFPVCRDRSLKHRVEIEQILRQVPLPSPVSKPL
jgi:hypothetical protein